MVNYDLCENDFLKLARAISFSVGASPVEPSSNLNIDIDKVLMLLVKQAAAGFNASMEIFAPSRNATLYDIDTPILSQHVTTWNLILQHLQRLRGKTIVQGVILSVCWCAQPPLRFAVFLLSFP